MNRAELKWALVENTFVLRPRFPRYFDWLEWRIGELRRDRHRAAQAKYARTAKGKATSARYERTDKGRARSQWYDTTTNGRIRAQRYRDHVNLMWAGPGRGHRNRRIEAASQQTVSK
jgi:hypothetical protein